MPIDSVSAHLRKCLIKCLPEGTLDALTGDTTGYLWCLADCLSPIVGLSKRQTLKKLLKDKGKMGDTFRKLDEIRKKWKKTKAKDALSGKLKKSKSYHAALAEKTIEELEKIKKKNARTKDEKALKKKACQMLKLIKEAARLRKKLKDKKMSFVTPVKPEDMLASAAIDNSLDDIRSALLSDEEGPDIYQLFHHLLSLGKLAPESLILRAEVAHFRHAILDDPEGASIDFAKLIGKMETLFSEAVPALVEIQEETSFDHTISIDESVSLEQAQHFTGSMALSLQGVLEPGESYSDLSCFDDSLPTLTKPIPVVEEVQQDANKKQPAKTVRKSKVKDK